MSNPQAAAAKGRPTTRFIAGARLDVLQRFVVVLISEEAIGASVERFTVLPSRNDFQRFAEEQTWLILRRDTGTALFVDKMTPTQIAALVRTPAGIESLGIAYETALYCWPEWCPFLLTAYRPQWVISLPNTPVEE